MRSKDPYHYKIIRTTIVGNAIAIWVTNIWGWVGTRESWVTLVGPWTRLKSRRNSPWDRPMIFMVGLRMASFVNRGSRHELGTRDNSLSVGLDLRGSHSIRDYTCKFLLSILIWLQRKEVETKRGDALIVFPLPLSFCFVIQRRYQSPRRDMGGSPLWSPSCIPIPLPSMVL